MDPSNLAGNLAAIDPVIHAPALLLILTYLYVVDGADFTFLRNQTGLTWGNLSVHLSKLEAAGYVTIEKGFEGKKPHTWVSMTDSGRQALVRYRDDMRRILRDH